MGFALMAQGFFSVVYHICPTNLGLQFDTTMMYVMCVLCFVKLYQFRHPDATANAFSIIGILGNLFKQIYNNHDGFKFFVCFHKCTYSL